MTHPDAQALFNRAITANPRNPYLTASLATLQRKARIDKQAALRLLRRNARDICPGIASGIARDFAQLMLTALQNGRI